jgi:gluconolactonase
MLKKFSIVVSMFILFYSSSCAQEVNMKDYKTIGKIQREDPAIDELIPRDAVIEVLADGFDWSEGPVWIKKEGFLLFTDIPKNSVFKWNEQEGLSLYLRPAGFALGNKEGGDFGSNGLFINPVNEQLILCDHGNRCITELNRENWSKKIIIDSFEGKRLNSPNDIVISSKGHFYFTDPPYGLPGPDRKGKELDFSGVFHLKPDGSITLITKELDYPNGIALSPEEKTLYIANSGKKKVIMAFDVAEDGTATNGRIFYDATGFDKYGKGGGCDGMAIDEKGNIWATGPGGVMIFTPEGKFLGSIDTDSPLANCKFGGADGKELYITANNYLCRVKVNVKGVGF